MVSGVLPIVFSLGLFAILTQMDVILVKHYLPPEMAGNYAAVFTLGKIIFFSRQQ